MVCEAGWRGFGACGPLGFRGCIISKGWHAWTAGKFERGTFEEGDAARKEEGARSKAGRRGGEKLQAQFGPVRRVVRAQTRTQGIAEENVLARWHDTMSGVLFIAFK